MSERLVEDCWACANENARQEFRETGKKRMSFFMYLCPECGNKRCAKANDHLFDCDKGAVEAAVREMQDRIRELHDAEVAAQALRDAVRYARPDAGDYVGMTRSEAEAFEDALTLVEEYADRIETQGVGS